MIEKNNYDWDLEYLLNGESLEILFENWKEQKENILKLYEIFYKNEENFINWKKENLNFEKLSNRISNYISNNLNEDVNNEKWISWSQKLSNEMQDLSLKTSNISNIIVKNKKQIILYLKNPLLKDYVRDYELFFKSQKHILSPKEEKLLSNQSLVDQGFEDIFSVLTDGTISFEDVITSTGKKIKINNSADFSKLLISKDRTTRKNAWYSFHGAYFKYKELLVQTLYYNYLMLNTNSKIRKYKDYIDGVCDSDEINVDFIKSIYNHTKNFKPLLTKFERNRNAFLKYKYKLNNIEPWDKSLELSFNNKKYEIEELKSITLDALNVFGDDYIKIIQRAFDEKWISWLPKPKKHSGAYSIGGTYGLDRYYISMNYDSTISSLFTLVHELGHSLHSYYFGLEQEVNASCKIFYAEIASITNEVILSLYLLEREKKDIEKLKILDELIGNFFATTTRQIIFSNFEYEIINKLNNNEPITFSTIKDIYFDCNAKYLDISKKRFYSKKYEVSISTILRISHFYVGNFYVYKYAIGQVPALIAGYKIFNGDKDFLNKYKSFLKSGSSLSPLDTINILGIDLSSKEVWEEVNKIINSLIDEFIKISNRIKK